MRRIAVRVHFNEQLEPVNFGIAEWPLESPLRNIVISCPADRDLRNNVDRMYSAVLGLTEGELRRPVIAIGGGWSAQRPPRWPDPEYPAQVHIDFFVTDIAASGRIAREAGATVVQDDREWRTYADPAGHPFCLYPDPRAATGDSPPGRVGRIVIDSSRPRALAPFYEGLLNMPTRVEDSPELVVLAFEDETLPMIALQEVASYVAPRWDDPRYPSHAHLDLHFEDQQEAAERALRLGAIRLRDLGGSCPVYADPAGHPFCLCLPGQ
jgi:hypothetical protein